MSIPYKNVEKLLKFFQSHPNTTFTVSEVCEATGVLPGSLNGSFRQLMMSHKNAVMPGRGLYRWNFPWDIDSRSESAPAPLLSSSSRVLSSVLSEPAKKERELFELIGGPTSNGEYILQSESGALFKAVKI